MSKERLVPDIRIEGFEDEWEDEKFKQLGSIAMCKRIYKNETSENYEIPFYKIGTFGKKADTYISKETYYKYKELYPFPSVGDVLISAAGTIGKTVVYDGTPSYFQDSNIIWLNHTEEKVLNEYLRHYYEIIEWDGIEGSTIKRLYNNIFLNSKINHPNITEQKIIAKTLTNLNDVIGYKQKELNKLQNFKQAMLQKMFPKEGETVPEVRFDDFEGNWEKYELREIADIVGGGTPSTTNSAYWNGAINWYSPVEIGNKTYVDASQNKITKLGLESSSAKILPVGTVLFTSRAGIGKTAILAKEGATNQGFQSIIPHKNVLDSYFIYSKTNELKKYGENKGAGSTFVEVSGKQMGKMPLLIPTIDEQKQIGYYFKKIDQNIQAKQTQLTKLKQFKQAMLNKMFV